MNPKQLVLCTINANTFGDKDSAVVRGEIYQSDRQFICNGVKLLTLSGKPTTTAYFASAFTPIILKLKKRR